MALIPSIVGEQRRNNVFDPFSQDDWDSFDIGFPFPNALSNSSSSRDNSDFASAKIDWKETPKAHVFTADLPGLKKEEINVEVEEGQIIHISGERCKEKEDKNDKWHRLERRSSGKFQRRFMLPENAKTEQIKVSLENGVLTVTVLKEPEGFGKK
ncbi:18.1 kDa class I heat shock protein-like isoform X2 [Impatiens glandulifera]|uniref:18.1 kDa class I heat shock protein-like isoform X2 n=1 Tax=Impatiens glandulifera TaxID=253017 RepID=UPI001FB1920D|nr:18.1 kDa class I heat shock protein-like isoform X2 [Impatiens glandulifera]